MIVCDAAVLNESNKTFVSHFSILRSFIKIDKYMENISLISEVIISQNNDNATRVENLITWVNFIQEMFPGFSYIFQGS